jgi:hypothetical protein
VQTPRVKMPVKHPKSLPWKHVKSYKRLPILEAPNGGKRLEASHRTRRSFAPQSHKVRRGKDAAKKTEDSKRQDCRTDNENASNAARPRNFGQRRSEGVVKAQQCRSKFTAKEGQRRRPAANKRKPKFLAERNKGQRENKHQAKKDENQNS